MWSTVKNLLNLVFAYKNEEVKGKKPWQSKTIWVNVLSIVALLTSQYANIEISAQDQVIILSVINIILRMITKQPTGFYEDTNGK